MSNRSTQAQTIMGGYVMTCPPGGDWQRGWRVVRHESADGEVWFERVALTAEDMMNPQLEDFWLQNTLHHDQTNFLAQICATRVAADPTVWVTSDVGLGWGIDGMPYACPDVAIIPNMPPRTPSTREYTIDLSGRAGRGITVIEITSRTTRDDDYARRLRNYERAGVAQHILIDHGADQNVLSITVADRRLQDGKLVEMKLDPPDRVWVDAVRMWIVTDGERIWCLDEAGHELLGLTEQIEANQRLEAQAAQEYAGRVAAEARAAQEAARAEEAEARLRAELAEKAALLERLAAMEVVLRGDKAKPAEPH